MQMKLSHIIVLIVLTLGCWLSGSFLWGAMNPAWLLVLAIVTWLSISLLVWAARKMSAKVWIYAGIFVLGVLFLPGSMLEMVFPVPLSQPLDSLMALPLLLIISAALVVVALLLNSGLNLYKEGQNAGAVKEEDTQAQRLHAGRTASIALVLCALLLAKALHNLYWFTVWDNTDDSLGYFWLFIPAMPLLFSGIMLSITLPGRSKIASLVYLLLIPVLLFTVSASAQRVDFRHLTEQRAEQANQAIETYYTRTGRYPQDLQMVSPWYKISLPGPVIIYGQDWCYDGGDDYYRLGYVYREHWSDPRLTGQIFRLEGEVPDLPYMCEQEIAALIDHYPDSMYEFSMDGN